MAGIGFRPLSGTYISQSFAKEVQDAIVVSVPSRGLIYLNAWKKSVKNYAIDCFRPLSGTYISQ